MRQERLMVTLSLHPVWAGECECAFEVFIFSLVMRLRDS